MNKKSTNPQNEILKEKVKQAKIRTSEMKKELVPVKLLNKWLLTYIDRAMDAVVLMSDRIAPELEKLFLAGKRTEATKKIISKIEIILKDSSRLLKEDIKKYGYNPVFIKDNRSKPDEKSN